jgi:nucleoside phosphorylase
VNCGFVVKDMSKANELSNKVSILFMTALGLEADAVEEHLDNVETVVHERGSVYAVGKIKNSKGYRVAVAEAGAGSILTAIETERAIQFFSPSYLIFVGIAGGIKDVRLGDVVAADRIYGYQMGADTDQGFQSRPRSSECSAPLVARARHECRSAKWKNKNASGRLESCHAMVAPVAAGEVVMKSTKSKLYEYLRSNYNDAIAVEMEGRGFLEAYQHNVSQQPLQAIVIRGISDLLADKEEADRSGFQSAAAAAAAAFAFHLLDCVLEEFEKRVKGRVVLNFSRSRATSSQIHLWISQLRKEAGDVTLEFDDFADGSIVVRILASEHGLQRLISLFKAGQLTTLCNVPVLDIAEDDADFVTERAIAKHAEAGYITGDTRVLTPGGIWRRIDQMIHLPSRVFTTLFEHEIHITDGAFPAGVRDIFELRTVGGYSVRLTGDSLVRTCGRGWIEARSITTADEVKLPSRPAVIGEVGNPQDPQFFQLLGVLISAANGDDSSLRLATLDDEKLVGEFLAYINTKWRESAGYFDDDEAEYVGTERHDATTTATLTHHRLLSRLRAFVRRDGATFRLSDEGFTAGLAAQKHVLKGLFSVDGALSGSSMRIGGSLGLLTDVQALLIAFGIASAISPRSAPPSASNASDSASDAEVLEVGSTPEADLGADTHSHQEAGLRNHGLCVSANGLLLFSQHIGLLSGWKNAQLASAVAGIPNNGKLVNYDCVASLRPLGSHQVFGIIEPSTASFVANGLVLHDSSMIARA